MEDLRERLLALADECDAEHRGFSVSRRIRDIAGAELSKPEPASERIHHDYICTDCGWSGRGMEAAHEHHEGTGHSPYGPTTALAQKPAKPEPGDALPSPSALREALDTERSWLRVLISRMKGIGDPSWAANLWGTFLANLITTEVPNRIKTIDAALNPDGRTP